MKKYKQIKKPKIAISMGDPNGVGAEIALKSHKKISKFCTPIYCAKKSLLQNAAKILGKNLASFGLKKANFFWLDSIKNIESKSSQTQELWDKNAIEKLDNLLLDSMKFDISPSTNSLPSADSMQIENFKIKPGVLDKNAGALSFASFLCALKLAQKGEVCGVCTLPINKLTLSLANLNFAGHTEVLRYIFSREAIMMLGSPRLFVGLFTDHIALKEVPQKIQKEPLARFLLDFSKELYKGDLHSLKEISKKYCFKENLIESNGKIYEKCGVLGLNPHAGDGGVLGDEEQEIKKAIDFANSSLGAEIFSGPIVPDVAFADFWGKYKKYKKAQNTAPLRYFVAMYHDQGLAPLKALEFSRSINVSLNLPLVRSSVDHGTAFDIAYCGIAKTKSYKNAIKYILDSI